MGNKWVLYDPINDTQSERLSTEEIQFALLRLKTKYINQFLIWRDDWSKWKKLNAFLDSEQSPFMSPLSQDPFSATEEVTKTKTFGFKMNPATSETVEQVRSSFEFSEVHTQEVSLKDVFKTTGHQFDAEQLSAVHDQNDFLVSEKKSTEHISFKGLNKQNAFGKRTLEDRFKIELLLIDSKGVMFRTPARDISLSGTFTDKTLPGNFHTGVFDIIVINNLIQDALFNRINLKATCLITDSNFYVRFVQPTEDQKNQLRAGLDYYARLQKKITSAS